MELHALQAYWWLLISVLGAILVFMLFVQGGQTMLFERKRFEGQLDAEIGSIGVKWELTFTTLVVFGGAFFASFPLFYSTSFGGAYWLWMLILFSFVLQAVSYEYRRKPGNLFGRRTYDLFLFINGSVGCILLGVAVGTLFFGGEFTVVKGNIVDSAAPVISRWTSTHGLEAIANWRNLLLGVMVLMLARTLASLYFLNNVRQNDAFDAINRRRVLVNGAVFVVLFLAFAAVLLTASGLEVQPENGTVEGSHSFVEVPYKYFVNLVDMWWVAVMFLVGVVGVLAGIAMGAFMPRLAHKGIWPAGVGVILVVLSLFFIAGYNNTAYYRSLLDPASSLTIYNSSSSQFTLEVMSWVSLIIPFVLAYIVAVWRKMNRPAR
ncbi:MAG: cytochrome d ubiquinol oxidase subunit II [Muribaculaceae bacterium]|nr:cytochrome d ubiquinol oxidase subunit II [Muribaculaceae bacterium]